MQLFCSQHFNVTKLLAKTYNNKCKDNIYFFKKNIQYKNCERLCVIINNIINKKNLETQLLS